MLDPTYLLVGGVAVFGLTVGLYFLLPENARKRLPIIAAVVGAVMLALVALFGRRGKSEKKADQLRAEYDADAKRFEEALAALEGQQDAAVLDMEASAAAAEQAFQRSQDALESANAARSEADRHRERADEALRKLAELDAAKGAEKG